MNDLDYIEAITDYFFDLEEGGIPYEDAIEAFIASFQNEFLYGSCIAPYLQDDLQQIEQLMQEHFSILISYYFAEISIKKLLLSKTTIKKVYPIYKKQGKEIPNLEDSLELKSISEEILQFLKSPQVTGQDVYKRFLEDEAFAYDFAESIYYIATHEDSYLIRRSHELHLLGCDSTLAKFNSYFIPETSTITILELLEHFIEYIHSDSLSIFKFDSYITLLAIREEVKSPYFVYLLACQYYLKKRALETTIPLEKIDMEHLQFLETNSIKDWYQRFLEDEVFALELIENAIFTLNNEDELSQKIIVSTPMNNKPEGIRAFLTLYTCDKVLRKENEKKRH